MCTLAWTGEFTLTRLANGSQLDVSACSRPTFVIIGVVRRPINDAHNHRTQLGVLNARFFGLSTMETVTDLRNEEICEVFAGVVAPYRAAERMASRPAIRGLLSAETHP